MVPRQQSGRRSAPGGWVLLLAQRLSERCTREQKVAVARGAVISTAGAARRLRWPHDGTTVPREAAGLGEVPRLQVVLELPAPAPAAGAWHSLLFFLPPLPPFNLLILLPFLAPTALARAVTPSPGRTLSGRPSPVLGIGSAGPSPPALALGAGPFSPVLGGWVGRALLGGWCVCVCGGGGGGGGGGDSGDCVESRECDLNPALSFKGFGI